MKKITITINTDNDAFMAHPGAEVARILNVLEAKFQYSTVQNGDKLFDNNGNTVGLVKVE